MNISISISQLICLFIFWVGFMGGIYILVLVVEQKWPRNGIIINLRGWFCVGSANVFELDPFKGVLGPSFAGKRPKTET